MARFIKLKCRGSINSFRQSDFHTYHKTLPLPPKTTVAGMIGAALGLSPQTVNDEWLKMNRFQVGIVGNAAGKANDLWQIRKYEQKTIKAYEEGKVPAPYKTAVIVRELLFGSSICLYFHLNDEVDKNLLLDGFKYPVWALSLGREDELIRIEQLKEVELTTVEGKFYKQTVMKQPPAYELDNEYLASSLGKNLLASAPTLQRIPTSFSNPGYAREPDYFEDYLFVNDFPLRPTPDSMGYFDPEEDWVFQLI
jgi:CRISPR-associated protein Cas5t